MIAIGCGLLASYLWACISGRLPVHTSVRAITLLILVLVLPVTLGSIYVRGLSTTGLALLACSAVVCISGGCMVLGTATPTDATSSPPMRLVSELMHRSQTSTTAVSAAWSLLAVVFLMSPLYYAGAMSRFDLDLRVAELLTVEQVRPLWERLPIEVGQCLRNREVRAINEVVPCAAEHIVEVIDELPVQGRCPDASDYDFERLPLAIRQTNAINGAVYCFVSVNGQGSWRGRIGQPGLAFTP